MPRLKRNVFDKLHTLFFGKDLRITTGEPYTMVRDFDFSSYYPESKYIHSQEPPKENVYDIRDFGADVRNEDNAKFINDAVKAAHKTKGTVFVSGGDYVSTTVFMESDVTLFIEYGSSICANKTGEGYNKLGIIHANGRENITFTGGGKIKGNGELFGRKPFLDKNMTGHPGYIDVIQMRIDSRAQLRFAHPSKYGGPVYLKNCKNIRVHNFIIENSAYWTFKMENCNGIDISDFIINNNRHVANADGLDICGSSNIKADHCFISTADDGICIKNAIWLGNREAIENIYINDCEVISCANSFKIGTETTYDIKNISVTNCKFMMTDLYPGTVSGIAVESADGARVENVTVDNIEMNRVTCPVFIRLCNRNRAAVVTSESANAVEFGGKKNKGGTVSKSVFNYKGAVKNIKITNIKATGVEIPVMVAGYRQLFKKKYVENVTLENIDMEYAPYPEVIDRRLFIPEYPKVYPECWRFRNLPSYALWARHCKNLTVKNLKCSHTLKTWKKEVYKKDIL